MVSGSSPLLSPISAPTLGGANDAEDCCLSVTQRPIPGNIVKAFRYLLNEDGCRVPAVVWIACGKNIWPHPPMSPCWCHHGFNPELRAEPSFHGSPWNRSLQIVSKPPFLTLEPARKLGSRAFILSNLWLQVHHTKGLSALCTSRPALGGSISSFLSPGLGLDSLTIW